MSTLKGGRLGCMKFGVGMAGLGLAMLMAVLSTSVMAQKMYRCGSVYQDHPCSGDQPGKVLGQSGATVSSSTPVVDAACAARGVRSQKISWARQAGRTQDEQLSAMPQETSLINEVYNLRGTTVEIRLAIEANCMAMKTRGAQAAALEDAAAKLRGADAGATGSPTAPAANAAPPAATTTSTADDAARRRAESDALSKKLKCGSIGNRIRSIRDSQRSGGSGEAMDRLKQQLQEMDAASREAGC